MSRLNEMLRRHQAELEELDHFHATIGDWFSGGVIVFCIWLYFAF